MAKTLAIVFGAVFVLVGLLGFVPNPIVGDSGIFLTNMLHNLVHLLVGVLLLVVAFTKPGASGLWLKIVGVVYLLVWILGLLAVDASGRGSILGLVDVNTADNWLHLVLGIVILGAGFMSKPNNS